MARRIKAVHEYPVEVNVDGVISDGWYSVQRDTVTVHHFEFGRKSALFGGCDAIGLARVLLREMIWEAKRKA